MSDERDSLRKLYGNRATFVSILPDGTKIPWNQLTLGEYLNYVRGALSDDDFEETVFRHCVTSDYLKDTLPSLKAGTVTTAANSIVQSSVPLNLKDLNSSLDYFRYIVGTTIYDQLVILVCRAFTGYTPQQLYAMKFEDFMHNVALAERKLLESGMLAEPVALTQPEAKTVEPEVKKPAIESNKMRDAWVAQKENAGRHAPPPIPQQAQRTPTNAPPVPEFTGQMTVIKAADSQEQKAALTGHELRDYDILQDKMLKETLPFYQDYMKMTEKGEKLTPDKIKSVEQRAAEAKVRMEENKVKFAKEAGQQQQIEAVKNQKIENAFQKHLPKRRHKRS
jgi:hypothetical protein